MYIDPTALITIADTASDVANSKLFTTLVQVAAYITPYFLIPAAFKAGMGVFGALTGMLNDRSRGFFDRQRKSRQNTYARKHQANLEGRSAWGTGRTGRAYRRVATGNYGLTSRQRRNFGANETALVANARDEALKRDNGRAFADDEATAAAIHATSAKNFIDRYVEAGGTKERAREALGALEVGSGAKIGTSTMRAAAYNARAASTKGYKPGSEGLKELYDDAAALEKAGIIARGDAAQAIKSNKSRADQSGAGYGDVFTGLERANKGTFDLTFAREMHGKALDGSRAGDIVAGHTDAIKALAPVMKDRLKAAADSGNIQEFNRQLAEIAGRYDAMAQISPNSAREMANDVIGVSLDGTESGKTVQQYIEAARSNPEFVNMRREYGSSARTDAARRSAEIPTEGS